MGLHLLSHYLGLVSLLLLESCVRILGMAICLLLILGIPSPLCFQLCVYEAYPPPCLLANLVEDLKDFLLLPSIRKTLACNSKRT